MILKRINKHIHYIIRENNLGLIISSLIDEKNDILDQYVVRIKEFLINKDIFDKNTEKYVMILRYLKKQGMIESDIKELTLKLFRLYDIPNKRNNIFLIFLLYFYINRKDDRSEPEIFTLIYIYFLIIVYRTKIPDDLREKFVNIDKLQFDTVSHKVVHASHKYVYFIKSKMKYIIPALTIVGGCFIVVNYQQSLNADLNSSLNGDVLNIVSRSFILGDAKMVFNSAGIMDKLVSFPMQNLLLITVLALIAQSVKTIFIDTFNSSFLIKMITYIFNFLKSITNIIFYIYNYFLKFFTTQLIIGFIYNMIRFRINISPVIFIFFMSLYIAIHLIIIGIYLLLTLALFGITVDPVYIIITSGLISIFIIYLNFSSNYDNFKDFIVEVESFLNYLTEKNISFENKKPEEKHNIIL